MFCVVRVDFFRGIGDFVDCLEGQQSLFAPVIFGKPGFLRDDRAPCCQITRAAVAEPTGVESDVLILRDGELAFGALDVIAVKPVIDTHLQR